MDWQWDAGYLGRHFFVAEILPKVDISEDIDGDQNSLIILVTDIENANRAHLSISTGVV